MATPICIGHVHLKRCSLCFLVIITCIFFCVHSYSRWSIENQRVSKCIWVAVPLQCASGHFTVHISTLKASEFLLLWNHWMCNISQVYLTTKLFLFIIAAMHIPYHPEKSGIRFLCHFPFLLWPYLVSVSFSHQILRVICDSSHIDSCFVFTQKSNSQCQA